MIAACTAPALYLRYRVRKEEGCSTRQLCKGSLQTSPQPRQGGNFTASEYNLSEYNHRRQHFTARKCTNRPPMSYAVVDYSCVGAVILPAITPRM